MTIVFALLAAVASAQSAADIPELRKAAERGDAQSQYVLGLAYEFGKGVSVDPAQAVQWYRKAADQEYPGAQFNLGVAYANGTGIAKDLAQAAQWYRRAANNGDAAAQYNLGLMYFSGDPLPQDFTEAYKWMTIATLRATAEDKTRVSQARDLVAARLPSEQIAEAQARALEWVDAFGKRAPARTAVAPPPPLSPPAAPRSPPPPAASVPLPIRVGGDIPPPRKVKNVEPVYPEVAQKARAQGIVVIEATIGPDGKVVSTKIMRSIPLLDAAAVAAVQQWEFTPTLLNGVPVPVIMVVPVNFTPR
jgi:TonB family protein